MVESGQPSTGSTVAKKRFPAAHGSASQKHIDIYVVIIA